MAQANAYMTTFRGLFSSALHWEDLTRLWQTLQDQADDGWYVYAVGETPPTAPLTAEQFKNFLTEIDILLRREHDEDYCGIVYANDMSQPGMVKIYDPNNLGSSCGSSGNTPPPLPGWIISRLAPPGLEALQPVASRRRWWQRLFD